MTPLFFTFAAPPRIVCGAGSLETFGATSAALLGGRPFIVTDKGVVACGLLKRLLDALALPARDIRVFDSVIADPPETVVLAATAEARACAATSIIGFGGGSPMDVAKLVALLANDDRQALSEVYGVNQIRGNRLPLALVPTTAGTGSEVTPVAIVTVGDEEKKGVVSPILIPDIAILDARLTLELPTHITAATGIDAMVHAIEAFTSASPNNNPISRLLAREALGLLGRSLVACVHDGSNLEARQDALLGACLAGQAFANAPVAAVHALAYPLGARFHLPHGLTNALMLPSVLRFNLPAAREAYAELLAAAFPGTEGGAEEFIAELENLIRVVKLPQRLRDVGIPADRIEGLAADAMKQTRLLVNNPRPVTLDDAVAIYREAW